MESRYLTMNELNKSALEHFIYQPVSREMIEHLALAAHGVIACDNTNTQQKNLPPTPPRSPERNAVKPVEDDDIPSVEQFITQLVVSSNVQVPTLMSTLVYLTRLKSRLQPMARGLRCTTHRIFLAALILSAKYLNDSSPKNKHWANYTRIVTDSYSFGFNRTEVNLMEKQLLFLLEWDLRITEHDLYTELDTFLEPLRHRIAARHAKKMRLAEEKRKQQEMHTKAELAVVAPAVHYPTPPASRDNSRSRHATPEHHQHHQHQHSRSTSRHGGSLSPPELSYSSAGSPYSPSDASSRPGSSRAPTPEEPREHAHEPYLYDASQHAQEAAISEPALEIVVEAGGHKVRSTGARKLPYELGADEYNHLQHDDGSAKKRGITRRGVWGRLLGGAIATR
jgi:G1/S-specific cyclin PLC1